MLPNVYENPIDKKIDNVQYSYRSNNNVSTPKDVNKKINEIFASKNHVYKSKVRITLREKIVEEYLVGKTNISILTLDGKIYKITDILDIELIN